MSYEQDADGPRVVGPMTPEKAAVESLQVLINIEWLLEKILTDSAATSKLEREALKALDEYLVRHR